MLVALYYVQAAVTFYAQNQETIWLSGAVLLSLVALMFLPVDDSSFDETDEQDDSGKDGQDKYADLR